jgi:hypothetical protein
MSLISSVIGWVDILHYIIVYDSNIPVVFYSRIYAYTFINWQINSRGWNHPGNADIDYRGVLFFSGLFSPSRLSPTIQLTNLFEKLH